MSDLVELFSPSPALNALLFSMNLCSFAAVGFLYWQFNRRLDSEAGRTDEILEYSLRKVASKLRETSQKLAQHERALKKMPRIFGQYRSPILKKLLALSHEQKCLRNKLADISPFKDKVQSTAANCSPLQAPAQTHLTNDNWLQAEASEIVTLLQPRPENE